MAPAPQRPLTNVHAIVPPCSSLQNRAQAYVGAFLRRNANARPTTAAAAMQDELLCELKRTVICCRAVHG